MTWEGPHGRDLTMIPCGPGHLRRYPIPGHWDPRHEWAQYQSHIGLSRQLNSTSSPVAVVVAAGYDPIGTGDRKWGGKLLFAMAFHAIYYLLIDDIALRAKPAPNSSAMDAIKGGCLREFIIKGGERKIDPNRITDRHHMGCSTIATVLFEYIVKSVVRKFASIPDSSQLPRGGWMVLFFNLSAEFYRKQTI